MRWKLAAAVVTLIAPAAVGCSGETEPPTTVGRHGADLRARMSWPEGAKGFHFFRYGTQYLDLARRLIGE